MAWNYSRLSHTLEGMARLLKRRWKAELDSGGTRRERTGCDYQAYVPDPLVGRSWSFDGDVTADIADAEADIVRLNARVSALSDTEGLARILLRAEAVASSRIEGLEAGPRRILRAEATTRSGEASRDVTADDILGNIRAMQLAVSGAEATSPVTVESVLGIHAELLRGTRHEGLGGTVRNEQNWIGGSNYNPCGAAFVPPPPEFVPELLEDLCAFCSSDDLSPLAQASIAHAQFETIHPFADGNGRTGRALIHIILRRRGIAPVLVPPISLVLATWSRAYIDSLAATRYEGSATSPRASEGTNRWLALAAAATRRAVADAVAYEEVVDSLQAGWRERLGGVRANSSLDLLLRMLPGAPVFTVRTAEELTGRTFEATNRAVSRLVETSIANQVKLGKRNRAFEVPELIEAFVGLERRLASPAGDTRHSPPARPVPSRQIAPKTLNR